MSENRSPDLDFAAHSIYNQSDSPGWDGSFIKLPRAGRPCVKQGGGSNGNKLAFCKKKKKNLLISLGLTSDGDPGTLYVQG